MASGILRTLLALRYVSGETLATLAGEAELPPCLLVRRLLELIPEAQGLVRPTEKLLLCMYCTQILRNPLCLDMSPCGDHACM